ncbi:MAG: ACT domain-containing protein, partial [Pirellulales bacterium]
VIGKDKPGLVEAIAKVVADHDANWVESRMAHLAGQFAGILRVEVERDRASQLVTNLKGLNQLGLESIIHSDADKNSDAELGNSHEGLTFRLELLGQDQPGIVRQISQVLATHCVNVEQFQSERIRAANTGQALFRASAQLRLPTGTEESNLRQALEHVAADMMVDLEFMEGE